MATLFNVGKGGAFSDKGGQSGSLSVDNATLLGYEQEIVYFGSDIGFKKTVSLKIKCAATDITNTEGVAGTSKDLLSSLSASHDYNNLTINGMSMGPAKVRDFFSDAGDLVNVATCSMSFLIHESFDDVSGFGGFYEDYAGGIDGQILDSFTDSLSLSQANNTTSYSRTITISANKSKNISKLGDVIASFVRDVLLFGGFAFPDFHDEIGGADINKLADGENGYKKFITETIDNASNTYTFTESLEATNIKNGYSLVITNVYSRNEKGVETVTENGSILGLEGKTSGDRIVAAEKGYEDELELASDRMTEFYEERRQSDNCPELNTEEGGDLLFMTKGKTINTFEGSIEYTLVANNDPKYKDGEGERWEFTLTVDNDGVYETATEQGSIKGGGYVKYDGEGGSGLAAYPMYQEAKDFFEDGTLGILETLSSRVSAAVNSDPFAVSPKPTRRTEAHSPRQGVINYSRSFSNNPIYQKNDSTNKIKKLEVSATLHKTVPITHEFVSLKPEEDKKIIQKQSTKSLSTLQNTITALAYRVDFGDGVDELTRIGWIAADQISSMDGVKFEDMDGDTMYMSAATFSFSYLNDVIFTLNPTYKRGKGSCPA